MYTLFYNLLAEFGVTPDSPLTVFHLVVAFGFVMSLTFIADLIHSLMSFGRRL